jgi:hypothetical protein
VPYIPALKAEGFAAPRIRRSCESRHGDHRLAPGRKSKKEVRKGLRKSSVHESEPAIRLRASQACNHTVLKVTGSISWYHIWHTGAGTRQCDWKPTRSA